MTESYTLANQKRREKEENYFSCLGVSAKENYFEGLPQATYIVTNILIAISAF